MDKICGSRISDNFFPTRNVLENHDLGKTLLPPQIFLAGTPMSSTIH